MSIILNKCARCEKDTHVLLLREVNGFGVCDKCILNIVKEETMIDNNNILINPFKWLWITINNHGDLRIYFDFNKYSFEICSESARYYYEYSTRRVWENSGWTWVSLENRETDTEWYGEASHYDNRSHLHLRRDKY